MDRPITYGLLIRLFSLNGLSLWLVVFFQAYLVSWLIFKLVKNVSGTPNFVLAGMLTVILLSVTSS